MSIPNETPNPQVAIGDDITIDETGKIVIKDSELAKMSEELSEEELNAVSGGELNISKCHCTSKLEETAQFE